MPPDHFTELHRRIAAAGVRNVVIEMLDMSTMRQRKLTAGRVVRLVNANDTIGKEDRQYVRDCTAELVAAGFEVAKKGMPFRSEFYTPIEAALGKVMPSLQTFINTLFDRQATEVTFADFIGWVARHLDVDIPVRGNALRGYLLRNGFETWKAHQRVDTFRDLMLIAWNDPKTHVGVQNHSLMQLALDGEQPARDADGNAILLFNQPTNEGR